MPRASTGTVGVTDLRIHLLGRLRIEREMRPLRLPRRKVESLLAYLVLQPGPHTREHLAALFWGDTPDAQARHSLRTALASLRKSLGSDLLIADRERVQFNPDYPVWVDALEFRAQAVRFLEGDEPVTVELELYQGDLLTDFYDEWLRPEREQFHELYLKVLLALAGKMRGQGEYGQAITLAERALAADPTNEQAHQTLMVCYAATGNRSAAARQYAECRRVLLEALGVEPGPETSALYQWIKQVPAEGSSIEAPRARLPIALTSFIGREREKAKVTALLAETRLLTITGAGGSGKTRLAIQVASELVSRFKDGVWFVELARLTDGQLVPQGVASVLNVREVPDQPLSESLVGYLRSRQALIVLDNCEHLIDACANLAALLLSACPELQILATSREALGITGEVAWQVPTLSLPAAGAGLPLQSLMQSEAVRLFVERAQAVNQSFAITEQNAPAVLEVCRQLEGIPLALELTAARLKLLSVEQIAARLDDRFNLLTIGSRAALPRHQTLRALIDWSHDLLADKERAVLRRLSVFAGGFTLAGATTVCAGESIEESEVLDLLSRLTDKSLVVVEARQAAREPRYRLLDTIRQYAADRLGEAGEAASARRRHAEYFLGLAEEAEPWLMSRDRRVWLERLEAEHDNLRLALEWGETTAGGGEILLRLAGALHWFWTHGSYLSEARRWLNAALAREDRVDGTRARAKVLAGAGYMARAQGDTAAAAESLETSIRLWRSSGTAGKLGLAHALVLQSVVARDNGNPLEARSLSEEAVELFRELGDRWGLAYALSGLAMAIRDQQDFALARSIVEESVALWRTLGDEWGQCEALHDLGLVALRQGDYKRAFSMFEELLEIRRASGSRQDTAYTLLNLALVSLNLGDEARARPFLEESLTLFREMGIEFGIGSSLLYFGYLAQSEGDSARAQSYFAQALDLARKVGPIHLKGGCLAGLAGVAAVQGQPRRAALLWGAAETQTSAAASYMDNADCIYFGRTMMVAQAQLGEAEFEAARREGRAMPLETALAYALQTPAAE